MNVAIVTPWVEHPELVEDYFVAVSTAKPDDELIIVDNGSDPPLDFATIRLEDNEGFAPASNYGLHHATADAVLFLNNDVKATSADWLDRIRGALEPGILVGGSLRRDRHSDVDGKPFPYLDGWCLAGMRDDLLDLDGFDETFDEPAYYSDNDLCLRARLAGMTLRQVRVGLAHRNSTTAGPHTLPGRTEILAANYSRYAERAREAVAA